ncbi:MAG TPA: isoprenylcysteine carboxylmethyltransferase family protein [Elusimicrobiota bacterium]|nr:isoprenylcysteine carboxylmethyltransferase family protein [Elusimicrobiota bacterium]
MVALCTIISMWATTLLVPSLGVPIGLRRAVAIALACIGQGISISGIASFRRAKTTVNPMKADTASSLVTTGVYRFTRNPMYLGLLIVLAGWAVFLANPLAVLFLPAFALYITRFQIKPEERILSKLFGSEYASYMSQVRRWI